MQQAANQERQYHKYDAVNTAGSCMSIYVTSLTPLDNDVHVSKMRLYSTIDDVVHREEP